MLTIMSQNNPSFGQVNLLRINSKAFKKAGDVKDNTVELTKNILRYARKINDAPRMGLCKVNIKTIQGNESLENQYDNYLLLTEKDTKKYNDILFKSDEKINDITNKITKSKKNKSVALTCEVNTSRIKNRICKLNRKILNIDKLNIFKIDSFKELKGIMSKIGL